MERTLLIAGKELPDGESFASGAVASGRKTIITRNHTDESASAPNGTTAVTWNRPSALSARSVILKALNECGHLDECVIIFDEKFFIEKYGSADGTAENVRVIEELISSYQYMTMEAITRALKKNKMDFSTSAETDKRKFRIVFLHKTSPSLSECVVSKLTAKPSTPFISTASQAFKTYAQNIAAANIENEDMDFLLVNCDPSNELYANDNALSSWLFSYIAAVDALKRPLTVKQRLTWTKAGTKSPGAFGFFG